MQLDPFSYISGCGDLSSDDEYRDANVCRDINIYESDKKQKEKCGKKGRWVQDDDKNVQVCKWTKEVGCKKSKGFSCGDDNEGNETDETDFETETETDETDYNDKIEDIQKEKPNNNSNLKDNTMDSGDSGVNMNLGDNMTGDINISLPDTKNTDEDDNAFFLEVLEAQNDQVENINDITKLVKEKANSR